MTRRGSVAGGELPQTGTFSWQFLMLLRQTEGKRPSPTPLAPSVMGLCSISIKNRWVFLSLRIWACPRLTLTTVAECQL